MPKILQNATEIFNQPVAANSGTCILHFKELELDYFPISQELALIREVRFFLNINDQFQSNLANCVAESKEEHTVIKMNGTLD